VSKPELHRFNILGTPRPQGSMALFRAKSGHEVAKYANTVYEWRGVCTVAAVAARPDGPPLEGPLQVGLGFDLARPKSHYGTGKNAGKLKASAPQWMATAPDIDKLVRAVLDAIGDAGTWWFDDGQVAQLTASKRYCGEGEVPGVVVSIRAIPPPPATALLERATATVQLAS
jgi:Holliday junction resolvase RusA-like endonuclease